MGFVEGLEGNEGLPHCIQPMRWLRTVGYLKQTRVILLISEKRVLNIDREMMLFCAYPAINPQKEQQLVKILCSCVDEINAGLSVYLCVVSIFC